ncbi:glycosyltransferase family 39 protein [Piscinibacter sp.]|uniref:glycosyltransferase family 39 protein n=1 Tax=Piscinibacter sp. TaxID=1903157 RepID=UPI002F41F3D8
MAKDTSAGASWASAWEAFAVAKPAPDRRVLGWVAALCVGQVLLWGLAFGLSHKVPEIDSAEQFVWAFSLENGYWKHPPMPSWIMHGLIQLFGPSVALPLIATQASIVIALALTWRLGCEFMSPQRSLVAMALTSLVTYHNIGGDCINHNAALLPFQAAAVLTFYRATRAGQWHQWALAGLFAGLAMLVTSMAMLPLLGLLLTFALDREQHRRRQLVGLALAIGVFALVLLPHALWLRSTHFLPFRYAHSVAQALPGLNASLRSIADFLLIQGLRLLPFFAGLWFVLGRRRREIIWSEPAAPVPSRDRRFLWIAALAPLALTVLVALLTETELQSRWGANAFLLTGWLAMALAPRRDSASLLRRALRFTIAAQVLLCLSLTLSKTVVAEQRANFPGAMLALHAQSAWREHTEAPLRLVVSDIWLGGNIIANGNPRVAVLIDGHPFKSPGVKETAVEACGALVLDDLTRDAAGRGAPNPALDALMARATFTGVWTLPWADRRAAAGHGESGRVVWGIIAPRDPRACRL